jgi:hypothetical protein
MTHGKSSASLGNLLTILIIAVTILLAIISA